MVDIKYNGKISSTFSELSSEPVIQFVTNKIKLPFFTVVLEITKKIGYQVAVLYDITTDKVIWTYNVSILKIQVLVLMVISTFLLIIGQFLSMEIITDIIRDIKATRAKEYAYPEKNVRGTLSIIWENLLRKIKACQSKKRRKFPYIIKV